jgi:hypothetical protein
VLIEEQSKSFIQRVLEIEQELKDYPERKKELDRELILLARNYNKAHEETAKKEYSFVQVEEMSDMIQVRFSLGEREK